MKTNKTGLRKIFLMGTLYILMAGATGCSKDDTDNSLGGFIKASFNGELKEFKYMPIANLSDHKEALGITAYLEDDWKSPSFELDIIDQANDVVAKTYNSATYPNPDVTSTYAIQTISSGQITGTTVYNTGLNDGTFIDIKISSLANGRATGTFSGKLKLSGGNTFINVTNGSFDAPLK